MLVQPWDAPLDDAEWQAWLDDAGGFGVLAVSHLDRAQAPLVLPTHFTATGGEVLLHLARANPAWPHLEAAEQVRLVVTGDYAYVPGYWRAAPDQPAEDGVPTSYYTSVQLVCRPAVVDDPEGKAEVLRAQLDDLQPEGGHAPVSPDSPPYGRMLPGIRGLRLTVLRVDAKLKYDDHKSVEHRARVADRLDERGQGLDAAAARQQRRRTAAVGDVRGRRE